MSAARMTALLSVGLASAATLAAVALGSSPSSAAQPAPPWMGSWAAAEVGSGAPSTFGFHDQTVREIVHTTAGGTVIRIRISNVFGTGPLTIDHVHVGVRDSGASIVPGTNRQVRFGHDRHSLTIPVGQRRYSDPVALPVSAGEDLAVSMFFQGATPSPTWHPAALTTSYYSTSGDHSGDIGAASFARRISSWYFLDGVDVENDGALSGTVVTFGASTTDGLMSTPDANRRYPDDLARMLLSEPAGQRMSVLNSGISGNQLLADGGIDGVSAVKRFLRDAIEPTGVRVIILWEGTNDIAARPGLQPAEITDAYLKLISEAHHFGIEVIGATLQPTGNPLGSPRNRVRVAINDWIRNSGAFDGVADFDAALRDPRHPNMMQPQFTAAGQSTHPDDAGYQAVANVAYHAVVRLLGLPLEP